MSLEWRGKRVTRTFREAQRVGVNETMAQAIDHAKANHAWRNRSGTLEGSIRIAEFAEPSGAGFRGTWGSLDVRYALIHELGGVIKPVRAPALVFQVDGQWVRTQQVTIPARPYLRPAADAMYPNLAGNIRGAYRRLLRHGGRR